MIGFFHGAWALALLSLLPAADVPDSLLLILIDDVGAEHLDWTEEGQEAANPVYTPTMSALAAEGIAYENLWATPCCSPTRAALLTGRYGHRTGIGNIIPATSSVALAGTEATIAERLGVRGYPTALFGKWHLGNRPEHPCSMGFDRWDGASGNLDDYWAWERIQDTPNIAAHVFSETKYATTVVTDAAIAWIDQQACPWFACVWYNAAHYPYHKPPGWGGFLWNEKDQYRAMIEHLDGEIGRLLSARDFDDVTVWLMSDNGAPDKVSQWPVKNGKGKYSAYRGGIEVACLVAGGAVREAIAAGRNVRGQRMRGHAHAVDFYRTALALLPGPDPGAWPDTDSRPLYSPLHGWLEGSRDWNFTERAGPFGVPPGGPYNSLDRAVEENGYKAIWTVAGAELYDVLVDPWETTDLLADGISVAEQLILDGLVAHLEEIGL
jgi:arylsulfatase A-like enzyme